MLNFPRTKVATFAAAVALLFGLATLATGIRVLLGADPGYTVFRPLVWFNTAMGIAYVAVAILAWQGSRVATRGAVAIALLNLAVLCVIAYLYSPEGTIASTSLQAMGFRTAAWIVIFLMLAWSNRATPRARDAT